MKVMVTGASGFLGGHVAERLCNDGYDVTVLARRTSDLSALKHLEFKVAFGDITDLNSVMKAMDGVEAVLHCAGAVRHVVPYAELRQINVMGTRNVALAAEECGVRKIIYASSLGVMGLQGENNNGSSPERVSDRYCRSKAEAEMAFFSECSRSGIDAVALRPGVIYGPRDFTAAYHWFKMVEDGSPMIIGDGTSRFPLIYIGDLVEAFMTALERDLESGSFNLNGEHDATLGKIIDLASRELGKETKPRSINYRLALFLAYLSEFKCALTGYKKPPATSTFVVKLFGTNHNVDITKAKKMLGFSADTSLEKGMSETANWYKALPDDRRG